MIATIVMAAAMSVDFSQEVRPLRPELHSAGFGPRLCSFPKEELEDIKSMGFKASRTHDWAHLNTNERVCDNHHIFPLAHLDPKDPKNYYFAATDHLLALTRGEMGHEIFFRLGTSIEHAGNGKPHFNTQIPDDFDRVAENFAATVRHYNRGWANGFEWGIRYWEIWNEPDGANTQWCMPDGDLKPDGSRDEAKDAERMRLFCRFFVTALKRLKSEFGDTIMVGGPAITSLNPNREDYLRSILRACREAGVAPDFVSWHWYNDDYGDMAERIRRGRKICDEEGFPKCQLIINEWHYMAWDDYDLSDLWSPIPEKRAKAWTGPRSHCGIDSSCLDLVVLSQIQTSDLDQAYYYGCRPTGNWGFKDVNHNKFKVFYGLKMFGDLVRGGGTICRGDVVDPDGKPIMVATPVRSADGKTFQLLVVDYRTGSEKIEIDVAGLPEGVMAKGEVHDEASDLGKADFDFDGRRLVIRKSGKGSAAYRFVFTVCDDITSLVNPFIGTGADGHHFPAAACPFGLVQAGPDTGHGSWAYCSGYRYEDGKIVMFSQTHNPGGGCPDYADVGIMPFVGDAADVASPFSHASETAEPGYYAVTLEKGDVRVEVAATERAAIYRMRPGAEGGLRLLVDLDHGMWDPGAPKTVKPLSVERTEGGGIRAHLLRNGFVKNRNVGADIRFSPAPTSVEELPAEDGVHAPKFVMSFDLPAGRPLVVKCGFSATDADGAKRNLDAEIPGWDFDAVRAATRAKWRGVLCRVDAECTDADAAAMFATALYHVFLVPTDIADVDGRYRGGDGRIAVAPNGHYYSELAFWDTFRCAHPFYTIVRPEVVPDFVNSMLTHFDVVGYLPVLPKWGQDTHCMIATHGVSVIAEAFAKGFKGVDWNRAYAAVKDTLTKPHPKRIKENWDLYDRYGYYPCDVIKGESVSRTLECGYDDWCAGMMAQKLGLKADAEFFFRRSEYWRNIFDARLGVVRGKTTAGKWREPFNPYVFGHGAENDNDFTEGNAFQYTWHVLQNPSGLVEAFGGAENFVRKLDEIFDWKPEEGGTLRYEHATNPALTVDITGIWGQYVQGNEPSHHIPYLYRFAGRPDRTAERVREICRRFYTNTPDGMCGNEDHGAMSAWYVFACLGFYPVSPASGDYVLGAPQVEKVVLRLGNDTNRNCHNCSQITNINSTCSTRSTRLNTFTIIARNLSRENKYVKSVTLNGKPFEGFLLRHSDIVAGGELVFEMAAEPK